MLVGTLVTLGWNGAKLFDGDTLAWAQVRIEAIGADWVVVRSERSGEAYATGFPEGILPDQIRAELEE